MTATTCRTCHQQMGFTTLGGECPDCWSHGSVRSDMRARFVKTCISVFSRPRIAIRQMIAWPWFVSLVPILSYGLLCFGVTQPWVYDLPLVDIAFLAICLIPAIPIVAVIVLFVAAEAFWLLGRMTGGVATSGQLRATIVWSLWWPSTICVLPLMAFSRLVTVQMPSASVWVNWLPWIATCYCLSVFAVCLSEVQRFSIFRAALCVLVVLLALLALAAASIISV